MVPEVLKSSDLQLLPEDWERVRFSDICKVRQGLQVLISDRLKVATDTSHEYITVQSINKTAQEREYIESPSSRVVCKPDDVLMTRTGNTGIVVTDVKGAFHNNFFLIDYDRTSISKAFLVEYLRSKRVQHVLLTKAGSSTIPDLNHSDFYSIEFPKPPLPEQRKIAEILSTWDQAIEKTEALLSNARTQKRALMQQLLTGKRRFPAFKGQPWKEVRLRDLADLSPKMDVCPYDRRLTFLTMDAVTEEAMIAKPIEGNWDTHVKGFTQFKDDDILVAKITPCFENGKGCHASNLINGIGTGSTEFHVLRSKDVRDARFIYHVTNSYEFRGRGALNMQGSAGQRRVPTDFIRAYPLVVPENPDERQMIGSLLDEASTEIQHHKQQIIKLRTEKKALMQQLLTGKRRVAV